jgi:F-type H+-transporting ATPase subunit b
MTLAVLGLWVLASRLASTEELPEPKPPALVAQAEAPPSSRVQESEQALEHAAEQSADELNPLAFDPDLAIFTFFVFLFLVLILGKFAWPTITAALDAREKSIADNIAAAEGKHEEAKRLLAAHEARLAATADEVRELLEEARRDAEHTKTQIVAEARKAADEERKRAVREVDQAKDAALKELSERSANYAIELAGKIVREKLSANEQTTIIRDALGKLAASSPSKN